MGAARSRRTAMVIDSQQRTQRETKVCLCEGCAIHEVILWPSADAMPAASVRSERSMDSVLIQFISGPLLQSQGQLGE